MSQQQPTVVHEFEWDRRGFVRATIDEFKGRRFVALRLWVEPKTGTPGADLIPTAKGLSLPIEYADELLEAVQALVSAAKKPTARGRMDPDHRDRSGRGTEAA